MFSGITTFLLLAQSENDPGRGLQNLIIMIVFVGLYALSGLLRRKQDKSDLKPPRTTSAPPQSRPTQLPGYPRKTPPSATSQTQIPQTTQKPRPAALKPIPTSQRTAPPPRQPQQQSPQPQLHPEEIYSIPEQTRAKPKHPTHVQKPASTIKHHVAPKTKTSAPTAAKKQVIATSESAKLKKSTASGIPPISVTPPASDNVQLALDQQDSLVRAILYAEILDQPMALRRSGSHDFLDFQSPLD